MTALFGVGSKMMRFLKQWMMSVVITIGLAIGLSVTTWGIAPVQADDYTKDVLIGVDFSGRDLTDSQFTHTNLRKSNLSNTKLRAVNLFASNLEFVDLTGADLQFATLESARITDANLTNANLEGAYLSNAKLDRTTIVGADFTDADIREDMRKMLCKKADGVNPMTGRSTRETLYCDE